ncbi:MAG: hypothetical protein ACTSXF_04935 [Promethearchaeota archaeon]
MANKIGVLNGVILLFLNTFAYIPLGIYFSSGLGAYSGIPLYFFKNGNTFAYTWGTINNGNGYWWIGIANGGIICFILIQLLMLFANGITFMASFTDSEMGRKGFLISMILESVALAYVIIDAFSLGYMLGSPILPEFFINNVGMGFFILILSIVLHVLSIKTTPDTISE